jgi:hypothetical protein
MGRPGVISAPVSVALDATPRFEPHAGFDQRVQKTQGDSTPIAMPMIRRNSCPLQTP